jgi:hypothetical protein
MSLWNKGLIFGLHPQYSDPAVSISDLRVIVTDHQMRLTGTPPVSGAYGAYVAYVAYLAFVAAHGASSEVIETIAKRPQSRFVFLAIVGDRP